MKRLRNLGINLLGARNTALQSLVVEAPPPLVAELLGYSYNVTPTPRRDRSTTVGGLRHVAQAAAAQQNTDAPA
jgi:hypothetical protein